MEVLKIGWGRTELSLDEPVSIPGQTYIRRSEGILDPLYATALCVDGGEGQDAVIFCTIDSVSVRNIMDHALDLLRELRPDIPADNVLMGATHTHTGLSPTETRTETPDGKKLYPTEKVIDHMKHRIAEAVIAAWDSRKPGGIAYGYGFAVVAHSRRVCYFDDVSLRNPSAVAPNGHAVMYGKTNDGQFSHYEAGADHFLNALYTFDGAGALTGIVVNVPCPSQVSELFHVLSADYWHDVRRAAAKEFGENVYILGQCAAAGDLSPRILHYKQAQARRMHLKYGLDYNIGTAVYAPELAGQKHVNGILDENTRRRAMAERMDIAERILDAVKEIYGWARREIVTSAPVGHLLETVPLSRRMITDSEAQWCRDNIEAMRGAIPAVGSEQEKNFAVSRFQSIQGRNNRALARYAQQAADPTIPMRLHVVRIGDVAFATNRFELYMDYMHRMQARSPFLQTFIIQMAGEEGGSYLATGRGRENKGYSASLFCNQVSPEGGQQIVENTLRMLQTLKDRDS